MKLNELINGIYSNPLPAAYQDLEIRSVSCDSREEQKDGLFVALSGAKFNGEDFIKEAILQGAKVIVRQTSMSGSPTKAFGDDKVATAFGDDKVATAFGDDKVATAFGDDKVATAFGDDKVATASGDDKVATAFGDDKVATAFGDDTGVFDNVCVLEVDDPKYFLHGVGQRFYGNPSGKINSIGVTGTNGKTTVTYLIESIIHATAKRCGVIGTINYRIGDKVLPSKNTTPGFLDNQRYLAQLVGMGIDYCVMEASSHALDQGRLEGIHFSAGIFTNLTQDHLDYHKDMDHYFRAKSLLFQDLSPTATAVINVDDDHGKMLLPLCRSKIVTYAIDHLADVYARDITYQPSGSRFEIIFPEGRIKVHARFIGKHNIYNILSAFAWGLSQHLNPEFIRQGIENLAHVPGRLESVDNDKGLFIFIDYAHTDDGLINVLKALRAVSREKIILVFGCGGDRDRTKRPKMARAACALADHSIVTTDNPRSEDPQAIINEVITGFTKKNYETCVDRKEAIGRALKLAQRDQIVLIAGKGHENYQVLKDRTIAFNEREIVKEFLET